MRKFEAYKDDLMKIEGEFAVDKNTREIVRCNSNIECEDCLFNSGCSERDKIRWLYEEYEKLILSDDELELIKTLNKVLGKEYKYVARDKYNVIRLYEIKPNGKSGTYYGAYTYIDGGVGSEGRILFPNIMHKDGLYDIENKCFIKE